MRWGAGEVPAECDDMEFRRRLDAGVQGRSDGVAIGWKPLARAQQKRTVARQGMFAVVRPAEESGLAQVEEWQISRVLLRRVHRMEEPPLARDWAGLPAAARAV